VFVSLVAAMASVSEWMYSMSAARVPSNLRSPIGHPSLYAPVERDDEDFEHDELDADEDELRRNEIDEHDEDDETDFDDDVDFDDDEDEENVTMELDVLLVELLLDDEDDELNVTIDDDDEDLVTIVDEDDEDAVLFELDERVDEDDVDLLLLNDEDFDEDEDEDFDDADDAVDAELRPTLDVLHDDDTRSPVVPQITMSNVMDPLVPA